MREEIGERSDAYVLSVFVVAFALSVGLQKRGSEPDEFRHLSSVDPLRALNDLFDQFFRRIVHVQHCERIGEFERSRVEIGRRARCVMRIDRVQQCGYDVPIAKNKQIEDSTRETGDRVLLDIRIGLKIAQIGLA